MIRFLILYLIAAAVFFAIDMLWLGLVAKKFYREQLAFILSEQVNWVAAIIFYAIYLAGVLHFAVLPGLKEQNVLLALLQGAALGFLCYATYDLTNMATIAKWPLKIVLVDILWGTFLTGMVSLLSYVIAVKWNI
jgi:uncharacterized membrane protein